MEKPPDFGFIIDLSWEKESPNMEIVPNVIQFDSGESEKKFTVVNSGPYIYEREKWFRLMAKGSGANVDIY